MPVSRTSLIGLFAFTAFAVNRWTLGYLLTDDGTIDPTEVLAAILGFQTFCLLTAIALWQKLVAFPPTRWSTLVRPGSTIGSLAFAAAFCYWGLSIYSSSHDHTIELASSGAGTAAEQRAWADDFYQRSLDAAVRHGWFDYDTAMAQGFQPDPVNRTHFPNPDYMFDDVILDPDRPEWLVYHETPRGKTLMALMFFTRSLEEEGPTLGGSQAVWHFHPYDEVRCAIGELWTVGKADDNGVCAEGVPVTRTPEMLHLWFVDHPLGRFTDMKIVSEFFDTRAYTLARVHPALVHFTVGLFGISVLFDFLGWIRKKRELHTVAWYNLLAGTVFAVATLVAGLMAELSIKPTDAAHATLDTHKLLAYWLLVAMVALTGWRMTTGGRLPERARLLYSAVCLIGVGLLVGASHQGGKMVYDHGAGVRAVDMLALDHHLERVDTEYRRWDRNPSMQHPMTGEPSTADRDP